MARTSPALRRLASLAGGLLLLTAAAARAQSAASSGGAFTRIVKQTAPAITKLYGLGVGFEHGYGVGVNVSADGKVVTVLSLLLDSTNLRAVTADGRMMNAKVLRRDEYRQLALVQLVPPDKTDTLKLAHLTPGSSQQLTPGDWVVAVANPFKVADGPELPSVTAGVLSVRTDLVGHHRARPFPYQDEALIYDAITSNPGAPGGALLDIEGRWVGLIGKLVLAANTRTRLNWALPIEEVTAFLDECHVAVAAPAATTTQPADDDDEPAGRGYHGIRLFTLGFRRKLAYVESVRPGSPGDTAGLQADDLIMSIDNRRIPDARSFFRQMARYRAGRTVSLVIKRGQKVMIVPLTLIERPED